ncbi:hypothetical protein GJ496_007604 [Pomphorhynchus laevis]|nr:hypothetical protein GJ496_007604 [Pomphorhynchus laevis]
MQSNISIPSSFSNNSVKDRISLIESQLIRSASKAIDWANVVNFINESYDGLEDGITEEMFSDENVSEDAHLQYEPSDINSYDQEQFHVYSDVSRLMKFLQFGSRCATKIALCLLRKYDMSSHVVLSTIKRIDGIAIILNLITDTDSALSILALSIMVEATKNELLAKETREHGGIVKALIALVTIRDDGYIEIFQLLENLTKTPVGRYEFRQASGIPLLVAMLQIFLTQAKSLYCHISSLCRTLYICCKCKKNRLALARHGLPLILPTVIRALPRTHVTSAVALLNSCLVEEVFRVRFRVSRLAKDLISFFQTESIPLISFSIHALYNMSADHLSLDEIGHGLSSIFENLSKIKDHFILESLTGIVARLSLRSKQWDKHQDQMIDVLTKLLKKEDMGDIKIDMFKTLADLSSKNKTLIKLHERGLVDIAINHLTYDDPVVAEYAIITVGNATNLPSTAKLVNDRDALQKLWSCLKDESMELRISAARAATKCLQRIPESQIKIRQFIGGIHLLVSLLKCQSVDVLTAVCDLISEVAKNDYNLGILTDYNVLGAISKLMSTTNVHLRGSIGLALAQCVRNNTNKKAFASALSIQPLIKFMNTDDERIWRGVSCALRELSKCPSNCMTIYNTNPVEHLLKMVASCNEDTSYDAAMCLRSLRLLAMEYKNKQERMFFSPGDNIQEPAELQDLFSTLTPIESLIL